jgi:hypothetical protein
LAVRSSTISGSSSDTTRAARAGAVDTGAAFVTGFRRASTRLMADALYMKALPRKRLARRGRLRHHRRHSTAPPKESP